MSITTIEHRIIAGSQFTGTNGGSTGTVTAVAGSAIIQGESFRLRARNKETFTFVFDKSGALVDPVNQVVSITDAMTAGQVRDAIISAVNRCNGLSLYASVGGAAIVNLLNAIGGTAGNLPALADSVVNAGFVVSAMTGGVNYSSPPVDQDGGVRAYPPAIFGGMFAFDFQLKRSIEGAAVQRPQMWRVERVLADLATATGHVLSVVQADGTTVPVITGSGGAVSSITPILLTGDERLQLTTTGASGAMYARVTARPATF